MFHQAKDFAESTSIRQSKKRKTQTKQGIRLIRAARSALIFGKVVIGQCPAVAPSNLPHLVKKEQKYIDKTAD
jgi:hypothetical protein